VKNFFSKSESWFLSWLAEKEESIVFKVYGSKQKVFCISFFLSFSFSLSLSPSLSPPLRLSASLCSPSLPVCFSSLPFSLSHFYLLYFASFSLVLNHIVKKSFINGNWVMNKRGMVIKNKSQKLGSWKLRSTEKTTFKPLQKLGSTKKRSHEHTYQTDLANN